MTNGMFIVDGNNVTDHYSKLYNSNENVNIHIHCNLCSFKQYPTISTTMKFLLHIYCSSLQNHRLTSAHTVVSSLWDSMRLMMDPMNVCCMFIL